MMLSIVSSNFPAGVAWNASKNVRSSGDDFTELTIIARLRLYQSVACRATFAQSQSGIRTPAAATLHLNGTNPPRARQSTDHEWLPSGHSLRPPHDGKEARVHRDRNTFARFRNRPQYSHLHSAQYDALGAAAIPRAGSNRGYLVGSSPAPGPAQPGLGSGLYG